MFVLTFIFFVLVNLPHLWFFRYLCLPVTLLSYCLINLIAVLFFALCELGTPQPRSPDLTPPTSTPPTPTPDHKPPTPTPPTSTSLTPTPPQLSRPNPPPLNPNLLPLCGESSTSALLQTFVRRLRSNSRSHSLCGESFLWRIFCSESSGNGSH